MQEEVENRTVNLAISTTDWQNLSQCIQCMEATQSSSENSERKSCGS